MHMIHGMGLSKTYVVFKAEKNKEIELGNGKE